MRIAFYIPSLVGGGAERIMVRLANGFATRGHNVYLLVHRPDGPCRDHVAAAVRLIQLSRSAKTMGRLAALRAVPFAWRELSRPVLLTRRPIMGLRYLPGLAAWLARESPDVLVSALFYANLAAIWARRLSGASTRVIITQHNTLSARIAGGAQRAGETGRWTTLAALIGRCYPLADRIVAVSEGVAEDLAGTADLSRASITTIYNPVVFGISPPAPVSLPSGVSGHGPLIVAMGRLTRAKGFDVLLEAFARLATHPASQLMILGEGEDRVTLEARVAELGLNERVTLPGFVEAPQSYLQAAALFVLSSRHEGLPTVLIEAMACGCPVVSTDCPSGPREILNNGTHGRLVPVGDSAALAAAMAATLDEPRRAAELRRAAQRFDVDSAVDRYVGLCEQLGPPRGPARLSPESGQDG